MASNTYNPLFIVVRFVIIAAAVFSGGGIVVNAQDDHDDHDGHDHGAEESDAKSESCACLAEQNGWKIDCADSQAMLTAVSDLQGNNCADDCTSFACQKSYFMAQVHHDYCTDEEIPEPVEDALHVYEGSCQDCSISPKSDVSLPDCPTVNCQNTKTGNDAYQALVSGGCLTDCSSEDCATNYRTVLAVHDTCPQDTLDQVAELGFHEYETACSMHSCNVASTSGSVLLCDKSSSTATVATAATSTYLPAFVAAVVVAYWTAEGLL